MLTIETGTPGPDGRPCRGCPDERKCIHAGTVVACSRAAPVSAPPATPARRPSARETLERLGGKMPSEEQQRANLIHNGIDPGPASPAPPAPTPGDADFTALVDAFEKAVPSRGWDHEHERYAAARAALLSAVASLRGERDRLKAESDDIHGWVYCPMCGSCGVGGCCGYFCDFCKDRHDGETQDDSPPRDLGDLRHDKADLLARAEAAESALSRARGALAEAVEDRERLVENSAHATTWTGIRGWFGGASAEAQLDRWRRALAQETPAPEEKCPRCGLPKSDPDHTMNDPDYGFDAPAAPGGDPATNSAKKEE